MVGERFEGIGGRVLVVVVATWAVVQFDAFLTVLRRYATGWPSAWGEFLRSPEWAPPGGTILLPLLVLVLCGALAVAAHGFARTTRFRRNEVIAA